MFPRRAGFTTRASCLLAAGLTAIACGLLLGEVDLVRAGVLGAAVPLIAAVVVHRSRLQIANQRSVEPRQIGAGETVTVHLVITNRSRLRTGTMMLEDQLPDRLPGRARFVLDSLGGHEARTVSYRVPGLARGVYRTGPLRVRLTDPFRMIDLSRAFTSTDEFVVAPVVEQLPPIDPPRTDDVGDSAGSHSVGIHGADDQSTREYRIGDDLRKIHWRSSARTGQLMVRQEERPWRGQSTILLDLRAAAHTTARDTTPLTDPRQASSLEWAVSAAASIGARFLRTGRETGLLCDPSGERLRFGDGNRLAVHLAGVRELGSPDLLPMAGPLRTAARDSALVAVLGRLDPVTLRTLADAHPRGRSSPALALLLDVDTWVEPSLRADGRPVVAAAAVLRNSGWRVAVVRCGDSIGEAWQLLLAGTTAGRPDAVLR